VKNIPIIGKFLAVLGIFGLFVLATTIYATGQMQTIGSGYRQLLDGDAKAAMALARANRSLNATHAYIGDLLIVTSDADNQAVDASLDDSISKFSSFMDAAETLSPVEAGNIAAPTWRRRNSSVRSVFQISPLSQGIWPTKRRRLRPRSPATKAI
jgi:methyl-accepting chemotaxis protein